VLARPPGLRLGGRLWSWAGWGAERLLGVQQAESASEAAHREGPAPYRVSKLWARLQQVCVRFPPQGEQAVGKAAASVCALPTTG